MKQNEETKFTGRNKDTKSRKKGISSQVKRPFFGVNTGS